MRGFRRMKILVVNCGSSSIKYRLFDMAGRRELAGGRLERIGEESGLLTHRGCACSGRIREIKQNRNVVDHGEAMALIRSVLTAEGFLDDGGKGLSGIGHRVVHGGERFRAPALIDRAVIAAIERLAHLAPLHNPANLVGIESLRAALPDVPQVAVFDTAFHQSLPPHAFRYALPKEMYTDHGIRRYGFHGTSHAFVARQVAAAMQRDSSTLNLISLHLGNGASVAAIAGGRCIDTSMGMTPLEGLIMGTRCGDLDPAIVFFLQRAAGICGRDIERMLNTESGLKGLCGANDMRRVFELAAGGDADAALALDMYCYRIKKYIGAYAAVLGRVDALAFTAGVGEHSPDVRELVCRRMQHLGIEIDDRRNRRSAAGVRQIQSARAGVKLFIVPADEELEIAELTCQIVAADRAGKNG